MKPKHKLSALITVVRRGLGDMVMSLVKNAGAWDSTTLLGRGTSALTNWKLLQYKWLGIFGLIDAEKEIVFTLCQAAELPRVVDALHNSPELYKKVPAVGFVIELQSLLLSGPLSGTNARNFQNLAEQAGMDQSMENQICSYTHKLICAIINNGLADDLLLAAREAGASGGTIAKARGIARNKEEDNTFFGIPVMLDKEILMIVATNSEAPAILKALREAPCMQSPGAGTIFCVPVDDFFLLQDTGAGQ